MRSPPIVYSVEEMAWLEANRMMVISDYHRAFIEAFGRTDVEQAHLHGLRKRKGWKVGPQKGRTKGRRLKFSEAEVAWLRENCTLPIADCHRAFVAAFGRTDVTAESLHSLRKREGFRTGRTGRFEKGNVSHNKGKKCAPGKGGNHPNARRTQFKAGGVPHNTKFLGHERVSKDGYVEISVDQPNPHTGGERRYVLKHRWLWEKANGSLPEGYALKCLDGDKQNTDPSNWEAVPRALLPRLNGRFGRNYDAAPAELKPTIMAVAKLAHRAREIGKDRK